MKKCNLAFKAKAFVHFLRVAFHETDASCCHLSCSQSPCYAPGTTACENNVSLAVLVICRQRIDKMEAQLANLAAMMQTGMRPGVAASNSSLVSDSASAKSSRC